MGNFLIFFFICVLSVLSGSVQGAFYNCTKPGLVALTFDDGPHPNLTDKVLDVLKSHGVKATFFLNGVNNYEPNKERYQKTISRAFNEGHQLGSHTWAHIDPINETVTLPNLSKLAEDLDQLAELIRETLHLNMTVFRPPHGNTNERVEDFIKREFGYNTVMWDVDTRDWAEGAIPSDGPKAYQQFFNNSAPENSSCIGLQHDTLKIAEPMLKETLEYLLNVVKVKPVTVAECLGLEMYVEVEVPTTTPSKGTSNYSSFINSSFLIFLLQIIVFLHPYK